LWRPFASSSGPGPRVSTLPERETGSLARVVPVCKISSAMKSSESRSASTAESSASGSAPRSRRSAARAVIFDLDGVLVWTVPMHWRSYQRTFEAEGRPFPLDEYFRVAIGAPREQVIRAVLGDLPEAKMNHLMAEKERHVREYLRDVGIETIPGALDFVRSLRSRGTKTAVASASRTPELILGSVKALELFDAIVGRGEVSRSKPHPDLYLRAAEVLEVPALDCLVVEDSPVGIEAARAAGMNVLALTTTEGRENLTRASAVFSGFAEIPIDDWVV
jgi:beta-phosphoglucomutase